MTRKHFIAIAAIISDRFTYLSSLKDVNESSRAFDRGYTLATETIANDMADFLATQNSNFDRARFLTACGL